METTNTEGKFKIIASTNNYLANIDAIFNGKTTITLIDGLSYQEARERLTEYATSDYDQMNCVQRIETQDDYVAFYTRGLVSEMSYKTGVSEETYFETHKKMLSIFYEKNKNKFEKFTGPGLYAHGNIQACAILEDDSDSYEFDSRYYRIVNED